ncbi:MAG: hypothetical protein M1822_006962 [Bathelium mastoideum]|nr:MAG: hypothetical protein M1822_006962 [Bathelium mastoideum]
MDRTIEGLTGEELVLQRIYDESVFRAQGLGDKRTFNRASDVEDRGQEKLGGRAINVKIDEEVLNHEPPPVLPPAFADDESCQEPLKPPSSRQLKPGSSIYEPLDPGTSQIRVFSIYPNAGFDAVVEGHLQIIDLNEGIINITGDRRGYHALSYEWGAARPMQTIRVSGIPVEIRTNLHDALKHLRHQIATRTLWIDALCIDQEDVLEKNHQISIMKDIYSNATAKHAWLGLPTEDSKMGMEIISRMGSMVKNMYVMSHFAFRDRYSAHWEALNSILQRPYWTRLWTLQELFSGPGKAFIHIGHTSVPWACFLEGFNRFKHGYFGNGHAFESLRPHGKLMKAVQVAADSLSTGVNEASTFKLATSSLEGKKLDQYQELIEWLTVGRNRSCSLGADHVYAITSMLRKDGFSIEPNYDLHLLDIFQDITMWTIKASSSLDILSTCKSSGPIRIDRRPSAYRRNHPNIMKYNVTVIAAKFNESQFMHVRTVTELFQTLSEEGCAIQHENFGETLNTRVLPFDESEGGDPTQGCTVNLHPRDVIDGVHRITVPLYGDSLEKLIETLSKNGRHFLLDPLMKCRRKWPSWVTDWTDEFHEGRMSLLYNHLPLPSFSAAGNTEAEFLFVFDNTGLIVNGVEFDTIVEVFQPTDQDDESGGYASMVSSMFDWLQRFPSPYKSKEDILIALASLLCFGMEARVGERIGPLDFAQMLVAVATGEESESFQPNETSLFLGWPFAVAAIEEVSWCFITSRGYIGRGPIHIAKGNVISLFMGARVPFILERDQQVGPCRLLGECYIEGIMKGEAMRDKSLPRTTIVLE